MQDDGHARESNATRSIPRLYFTLPIPLELVQDIIQERGFRLAFRLLRNDAFAALSTLIHAGVEQKCSPDHPLTLPEFVDLFAQKCRDCREDPDRFRDDQCDKAVALSDYLVRGLQVAEALGVAFIPSKRSAHRTMHGGGIVAPTTTATTAVDLTTEAAIPSPETAAAGSASSRSRPGSKLPTSSAR